MHWSDEGVLLAARRHGESAAILEIFTRDHGRHVGLLRGGGSRRMAATLQPGTQLAVEWRARLAEHLGTFRIELVTCRAASLLHDPLALAALTSSCSLLTRILAERAQTGRFYLQTIHFLDVLMANEMWMAAYLDWELALLREAGRGLDLSHCVVTGSRKNLRYVSPRSGAAVSEEGSGKWAPKLLEIPACLATGECSTIADFAAGLQLTRHFLNAVLVETSSLDKATAARQRLETLAIEMSSGGAHPLHNQSTASASR